MKRKITRILSLIILMTSILSLSGCELLTGRSNTPPSITPPEPEAPPPFICYSVTTEKAEYKYGEEIEITATIQFNGSYRDSYHVEEVGFAGNFSVNLEKSPGFEIIGEESCIFENTNTEDYFCCKENTEKIVAKFKIKFNEATSENYVSDKIEIITKMSSPNEWSTIDPITNDITFYYILDSQGVIIQQIPYSGKHLENGHHENDYRSAYFASDHRYEMLVASYNREYLAGAGVEELLDRYILESGDKVKMWREYKEGKQSYSYISAGIRFKIYFPGDHEISKLREKDNSRESKIEVLETFLLFAFENGAITEEEYNGEIERISNEEQIFDVTSGIYNGAPRTIIPLSLQDDLLFPIPTDDECFNKVITVTNG